MNRRRVKRERRVATLRRELDLSLKEEKRYSRSLGRLTQQVVDLQAALLDPEGTIQRGINERYSRDLRERELEHHALWDQEVAVYQASASRRMRGLAAEIATAAGQAEIAEQILALPIYAEEP